MWGAARERVLDGVPSGSAGVDAGEFSGGARVRVDPDRELVTVSEAMSITKVSKRTIFNWIGLGLVESVYTAGGQRRIYADTLFKMRPPEEGTVIGD